MGGRTYDSRNCERTAWGFLYLQLVVTFAMALPFTAHAQLVETGPSYSAFEVAPLKRPDYLQSVTDPVFNTEITRVTGDYGTAVPGLPGKTWSSGESGNRHQYSHIPAWNADGSLLYIETAGIVINGRAPYEALYSVSWPSGAQEVRWDPANPDSMIFVGSNGVHRLNVKTGQVDLLASFPEYEGTQLFIGNFEGDIVDDGSKVLITGPDSSFAFPFYFDTNTRGPAFDLPANSDYATFSPLGNFIFVDAEPNGYELMRVYELDERTGELSLESDWDTGAFGAATPNHADLTVIEGVECLVGRTEGGQTINGTYVRDGAVVMRPLEDSNSLDSMTVLFPEGWCSHTSVCNRGNRDWAICTYGEWSSGNFPDNRGQGEIIAVRTDGSGEVRRIVHHRSTQAQYWAQAQASVSPDGSLVVFASDWGNSEGQINAYVAKTGIVGSAPPTPGENEAPFVLWRYVIFGLVALLVILFVRSFKVSL